MEENEIVLQIQASEIVKTLQQDVIAVKQGEMKHVKVKYGYVYKISVEEGNTAGKGLDLIAKKRGDDLEVLLLGDTTVVLDDYFNVCGTDLFCLVSLPAADGQHYVVEGQFVPLADGSEIVYTHGDKAVLSTIATNQSEIFASSFASSYETNAYGFSVVSVGTAVALAGIGIAASSSGDNGVPTGAPTVNTAIDDSTIVVGQAFSFDTSTSFMDPDGDTLAYSATGLPAEFSINAESGVITGTATASAAAVDVTVTATDPAGLEVADTFALTIAPAPLLPIVSSTIKGVTNFDVRSPIVLTFSEAVTANVGNIVIADLNPNGAGWREDTLVNTQTIDVTDNARVIISENIVTIDPLYDLDFATNYQITIGVGAFTGATTNEGSQAVELTFTTVTPTEVASGTPVPTASQKHVAGTDALVASHDWVSAHHGSQFSIEPVMIDANTGTGQNALVVSMGDNKKTGPGHILWTNIDGNEILYLDKTKNSALDSDIDVDFSGWGSNPDNYSKKLFVGEDSTVAGADVVFNGYTTADAYSYDSFTDATKGAEIIIG